MIMCHKYHLDFEPAAPVGLNDPPLRMVVVPPLRLTFGFLPEDPACPLCPSGSFSGAAVFC